MVTFEDVTDFATTAVAFATLRRITSAAVIVGTDFRGISAAHLIANIRAEHLPSRLQLVDDLGVRKRDAAIFRRTGRHYEDRGVDGVQECAA